MAAVSTSLSSRAVLSAEAAGLFLSPGFRTCRWVPRESFIPRPEGQGSPIQTPRGLLHPPSPPCGPLSFTISMPTPRPASGLPAASIEGPWLRLGRAAVGWRRPMCCGTESSPPFLSDFDREGEGRSPGGRGHLNCGCGGLGRGQQGFREPFPRGVTRAVSFPPSRCGQMRSKQFSQTGRTSFVKDNLYNIEDPATLKALREMNWLNTSGKSPASFRPRPGAFLWLPWQLIFSMRFLKELWPTPPQSVSPPVFFLALSSSSSAGRQIFSLKEEIISILVLQARRFSVQTTHAVIVQKQQPMISSQA